MGSSSTARWRLTGGLACIVVGLAACGGNGGGEGAGTEAADTSIASAAAPAALAENFRPAAQLPAQQVNAAAADLPAGAGPAYLKVWVDDAASAEPLLLALVLWGSGAPLPAVQAPATASVVKFEIYNESGSVQGQWVTQ